MNDLSVNILYCIAFIEYFEDEPVAQCIQKILTDTEENRYKVYIPIINLGEIRT